MCLKLQTNKKKEIKNKKNMVIKFMIVVVVVCAGGVQVLEGMGSCVGVDSAWLFVRVVVVVVCYGGDELSGDG